MKLIPVLQAMVQESLKITQKLISTIEGHTDSVGSKTTNQRLSERRANAVMSII